MTVIEVHPADQKKETLTVSLVSAGIILLAALLIFIRGIESPSSLKLKKHQRNASEVLNKVEWKKYSDLYTEGVNEIMNSFEQGLAQSGSFNWPTIKELASDIIPPFEKVSLQSNRGNYSWQLQTMDTKHFIRALYKGRSSTPDKYGSFILMIEFYKNMDGTLAVPPGKEKPYTIWYRQGKLNLPPDISEGTLIKSDWVELINQTGKKERKKGN
ncbi:MAG: DUF6162 family protein [Fibrobacterota bacterium]